MNSKDTIDNIDTVVVSSKVLASIMGVGDRRIRQLADEGIVVRSSQGRYVLQESLHNYIVNLKVENSAKQINSANPGNVPLDEVLDLNIEKAKHEHIKGQMAELKLALMKGQVYKESNVEAVMNDMLTNFKQKMLGMPAKLSLVLSNKETAFIEAKLTEEINTVLSELSDYCPDDFLAEEYIDLENDEEMYE